MTALPRRAKDFFDAPTMSTPMGPTDENLVRVWLVERTYSDDEMNVIILTYSTPDGGQYLRKERALTSFTDDRPTQAAIEVPDARLSAVEDPERREQYAAEAERMRRSHDVSDIV